MDFARLERESKLLADLSAAYRRIAELEGRVCEEHERKRQLEGGMVRVAAVGLNRRIILESPYQGDRELNLRYARACLADALGRGEVVMASHLLYTQVLEDDVHLERELGLKAGWAWMPVVDRVVLYVDRGVSAGMQRALIEADILGVPVEHRRLGDGWAERRVFTKA